MMISIDKIYIYSNFDIDILMISVTVQKMFLFVCEQIATWVWMVYAGAV